MSKYLSYKSNLRSNLEGQVHNSDSSQFDLSFGRNVECESLPQTPSLLSSSSIIFRKSLQYMHVDPPAAQASSVQSVRPQLELRCMHL